MQTVLLRRARGACARPVASVSTFAHRPAIARQIRAPRLRSFEARTRTRGRTSSLVAGPGEHERWRGGLRRASPGAMAGRRFIQGASSAELGKNVAHAEVLSRASDAKDAPGDTPHRPLIAAPRAGIWTWRASRRRRWFSPWASASTSCSPRRKIRRRRPAGPADLAAHLGASVVCALRAALTYPCVARARRALALCDVVKRSDDAIAAVAADHTRGRVLWPHAGARRRREDSGGLTAPRCVRGVEYRAGSPIRASFVSRRRRSRRWRFEVDSGE